MSKPIFTARPIFAVRLEAALRVKPFTSKEESRYYLQGIHISASANGGAVCAATDGHRLGVRHDPSGLCLEEVIVRLPAEIKAPPKKADIFLRDPWLVGTKTGEGRGHISVVTRLTGDEDTAEAAMTRVDDCLIRVGNAFIDGTFPDWRRVIPEPTEQDTVRGFNGEYVKGFGNYMTLRGADKDAPHLIHVVGEPEFVGVLMPMRPDDKFADGLPAWLARPEAEQLQAAE